VDPLKREAPTSSGSRRKQKKENRRQDRGADHAGDKERCARARKRGKDKHNLTDMRAWRKKRTRFGGREEKGNRKPRDLEGGFNSKRKRAPLLLRGGAPERGGLISTSIKGGSFLTSRARGL